jgi:hypothetical protein
MPLTYLVNLLVDGVCGEEAIDVHCLFLPVPALVSLPRLYLKDFGIELATHLWMRAIACKSVDGFLSCQLV